MLPTALQKNPADLLVIILTGTELGLAPMQAVRGIHIIKGKPTLAADTMAALVKRRRDICESFRIERSDEKECVIQTKRTGEEPETHSYTIEDAKTAKLLSKENWQLHPKAMLRARCIANVCRAVYPDLILGLYDPEEFETSGTIEPPMPKDARPSPAPQMASSTTVDGELIEQEKALNGSAALKEKLQEPKASPPKNGRKLVIQDVPDSEVNPDFVPDVPGDKQPIKEMSTVRLKWVEGIYRDEGNIQALCWVRAELAEREAVR